MSLLSGVRDMTFSEKVAELIQPARVLHVDIETSPHLCWSFQLWDANISPNMVVEPSRMLCWAAKWHEQKRVMFHAEWDDSHAKMVEHLWTLLNEATHVVTYNGIGFDEKHINREFILAGYGPPSPYASVDLLRTMRKRFKFPSNRLGEIGKDLGIGTKLETEGWRLWQAVLDGDEKARAKFRRYNIQDVRLTQTLYETVQPWIKGLPHAGMFTGVMASCYACGSMDLQVEGLTYTKTVPYVRAWCECGAWMRVMRNGDTREA